ncbi:MAG: hypothetical protein WBM96_05440, partial [Polyangiales bacterium]
IFNERIMLSSCARADPTGLLAGHTKMPFTLSTTQSVTASVCLQGMGRRGRCRRENLVCLYWVGRHGPPIFRLATQSNN